MQDWPVTVQNIRVCHDQMMLMDARNVRHPNEPIPQVYYVYHGKQLIITMLFSSAS
jgi:hypothetical protein